MGNSLFIPEGDKERAKGNKGEGASLSQRTWKKAREEIGEKHASFATFSSKENLAPFGR